MKKSFYKNILIILVIVAMFIIMIYESSKSSKNENSNKYIQYTEKYKGFDNQISYKEIKEEHIVQKYLSDYINLIMNDRQEAYKLVDDYYKKEVLNNYEKFNNKINIIMTKTFLSAKVVDYSVKKVDNYKLYYVKDADDNIFVFKEISIMNYRVYLDANTIEL